MLPLPRFERERPDALFVAPDAFFVSRRVQFATLAARDRIPAAYPDRDLVAAGGLMSYGTDFAESFHQVGVYTGSILKGTKPADLAGRAVDQVRVRHQPANRQVRSASTCRRNSLPSPTR